MRLPPGTKAKMCDVLITRTKLKVGLKGQPPILEVRAGQRNVVRENATVVACSTGCIAICRSLRGAREKYAMHATRITSRCGHGGG